MIYTKNSLATEKDFLALLEKTRLVCLEDVKLSGIKEFSGNDFERITFDAMQLSAEGGPFEGTIMQTGAHGFPDIIANRYFGVEVKVTTGDKWKSTGNSILESTRIEDVERIYLFFGKLGGTHDIKYRVYEECLYDIAVTHSPRYQIDMNLAQGASIFDKLGISYEALRKADNPINTFKNSFRKTLREGEELWWVDSEDTNVSPIITTYRLLSSKEKEEFTVRSMILFPEIFGNGPTKFERAAGYLIAKYNAVCPNLRDVFTAGGQKQITYSGKEYQIPAILFRLLKHKDILLETVGKIAREDLQYYWGKSFEQSKVLDMWLSLVDEAAEHSPLGIQISHLFRNYHYGKENK